MSGMLRLLSSVAVLQSLMLALTGEMRILPAEIKRLCKRWEIYPTLIDKIPNHAVEVMFDDGFLVEFGNELDEREVRPEPNIMWPVESNETYYTLIMTDPDNPTRVDATKREFLHWLVVNIPGRVEELGEEIAPWFPPHPLKACGFHRYTFIVFKQPAGKKVRFDEPKLNSSECGRPHFNTKKFAKKYCLGDPIAVNFFLAESYHG